MRCTVDLLMPNSLANLRHDQCVLPSNQLRKIIALLSVSVLQWAANSDVEWEPSASAPSAGSLVRGLPRPSLCIAVIVTISFIVLEF
jgi:hypothetical protein